MADVKVSVIVPNFNHERYLRKRLDSVFTQTFTDFEVILLDDASSDGSCVILEEYALRPNVSLLHINAQNSGNTFHQWNKGLHSAKGSYVWIAESDDYAADTLLEVLVSLLDQNPAAGMAYVNSMVVDEQGRNLYLYASLPMQDISGVQVYAGRYFAEKFMVFENAIPNVSACLFRAEALRKIDFSNLTIRLNGDWLIYHLLLAQNDIVVVPAPLNYFRSHSENVRTSVQRMGALWVEYLDLLVLLLRNQLVSKKLIKRATDTPLIWCLDGCVHGQRKVVSISAFVRYVWLFRRNPVKLICNYLLWTIRRRKV